MKVQITGKNIEVTGAIKDYVEKKLARMDKYFEEEQSSVVVISTEKNNQIVEVQLNCKDATYRAEAKELDLYASIDKSIDILEGQARKTKAKNDKKYRDGSLKDEIIKNTANEQEIEGEIVKVQSYSIKPMSIEDAKLELSGDKKALFLTYVDVDTKRVNVLFKTKDGKNFGIVEPEC